MSKDYMSILDVFSTMSTIESKSDDHEVRNRHVGLPGYFWNPCRNCHTCRTRLVGLAVLDSVASSEALFNCRNHFKDQVTSIVTALMVTVFQVDIPELEHA